MSIYKIIKSEKIYFIYIKNIFIYNEIH
jgi:hypothetical protein